DHGVEAARDRIRDVQQVTEDKRGPGNQAGIRADQVCCDLVAAATRRKEFDHLVVGDCNDEDGDRSCHRHIEAEMPMLAQRKEGFFRPVARRREAISAEADPCEEGDERDMPLRLLAERIEWSTEDDVRDLLCAWHPSPPSGTC